MHATSRIVKPVVNWTSEGVKRFCLRSSDGRHSSVEYEADVKVCMGVRGARLYVARVVSLLFLFADTTVSARGRTAAAGAAEVPLRRCRTLRLGRRRDTDRGSHS